MNSRRFLSNTGLPPLRQASPLRIIRPERSARPTIAYQPLGRAAGQNAKNSNGTRQGSLVSNRIAAAREDEHPDVPSPATVIPSEEAMKTFRAVRSAISLGL